MQALKPALYTIPPGTAAPQLRGMRCSCGYVFFPVQLFGCEKCGCSGDALQQELLPGEGRLVSSARVLMHAGEARKAPFVVVAVRLDAGPVVRTLLAADTQETLPAGQRMKACLIEVGKSEAGEPVVDLRFNPVHREGAAT